MYVGPTLVYLVPSKQCHDNMGISLTLDNLGCEHTKTSPDYSFLMSTKTSVIIFFYSGILINTKRGWLEQRK